MTVKLTTTDYPIKNNPQKSIKVFRHYYNLFEKIVFNPKYLQIIRVIIFNGVQHKLSFSRVDHTANTGLITLIGRLLGIDKINSHSYETRDRSCKFYHPNNVFSPVGNNNCRLSRGPSSVPTVRIDIRAARLTSIGRD